MKRVSVLAAVLCFMLVLAALCGCGDKDGGENDGSGVSDNVNNEASIYSVKIGDDIYSVGGVLADDVKARLDEICEVEFIEGDEVFGSSNIYRGRDFEIKAWVNEDENESGGTEEIVYSISTGTGETERGIAVGMTLEDTRAAYPGLMFVSGSCVSDEGKFLENTREYRFYDADDGTNSYLSFWFAKIEGEESTDGSRWVITGIEAADALDMSREYDTENSGVVGASDIHIEMPDGFTTRIFRENADGSEEELRYFKGAAESAELDGDGLSELVCFESAGGYRNIVILDMINGEIAVTDVNEKLGCRSSDYAGLIGNIKSEYRNCVSVIFEGAMPENEAAPADSQVRDALYDYKDGELSYRCPLDEALN